MNKMDPDRWKLIERLYNSALDLDPGKREEFLKSSCAGDNSLIKAVKRLLDHHEEAEDFLNVTTLDAQEGKQTESHPSLRGWQIGTYRIVSKIGRGGMGEVYQATDLKLERDVALKVLPEEFAKDKDRVARFQREAKALAALSHPNIATIFGLEESEGTNFLIMELIEGKTLADRIKDGPIPVKETLKLAIQIVDALDAAHQKGVIHRDLKPANIMVQPEGKVKVFDFGLAKQIVPNQLDTKAETASFLSSRSSILGTLPYMSTEQIRGKPVDNRSDIFSLGIVIFEMLTGEHPFRRESNFETAAAILSDRPPSLPKNAAEDPAALTAIIHKMIAKETNDRYQNMGDVKNDLGKLLDEFDQNSKNVGPWRRFGNAKFVVPAFAAIVFFGFLAIWNLLHENKASWARNVALPQISELIQTDSFEKAYRLAIEAENYIPRDPQLEGLMEQVSGAWSIETDPPDASIYIKEYGSEEADWTFLGNSPLENIGTSRGFKLYKIIKDGFAERYGILGTNDISVVPREIFGINDIWKVSISIGRRVRLVPDKSILPNMVFIDGGYIITDISDLINTNMVQLNDYLIDKFEVSNRDYMEFVITGGYQKNKYWKYKFVNDNHVLNFKEAMAEFVDKTGQPGPATWEYGRYPDGKDSYPVSGVCWYEAAAYAEFAGKQLPSVYHWYKAADQQTFNFQPVTFHSNFTLLGTSPVGSYQGIGPYGTYDMAGNVREWCWNGSEKERYILGGSWGEPIYMYINQITLPPMNRDLRNGFRCIKTSEGENIPEDLMKQIQGENKLRDLDEIKPVSDEIFDIYSKSFYYERTQLEQLSKGIDDSDSNYILETVSYNAAYDNERITAYIFIPKKIQKPYQPIIYFPGTSAWFYSSVHDYNATHVDIDLIIKSGRAAIFPVYRGTFQRKLPYFYSENYTRTQFRDLCIKDYKDLAQTIDYLETRPEFDLTKLTYYGLSWGAGVGSVVGALEKRIKGFIFVGGGIKRDGVYADPLPEYDTTIFAPRITSPVLIINGKFDPILPTVEILFNLLGTPDNDKRVIELYSGHVPPLDDKFKKEFLDWLNYYFGQVKLLPRQVD